MAEVDVKKTEEEENKKMLRSDLGYNPQCPRCGFKDKIEFTGITNQDCFWPEGPSTWFHLKCCNCGTEFDVKMKNDI